MEQEFTSIQEYVANHYQVQTHTSDEVFIDYNFPAAHERYDMGHFYEGKDPESFPVYSSPSPTCDGDKAEEPVELDLDLLQQGYSDASMNFDMDMIVRNMEVENVKPVEKKKKIFKILHDTVSTADSDCGQSSPDLSLIQVKVKRGRKSTKNYAESPAEDEEFICEEKLHKKSKQNPRRNGPGLIVKRVRTGLILLFDHDKKKRLDDDEFQRLEYMTKMVKAFEMNDAELAGFERFIREFSLQAKTWSNIEGNLKKNSNFAKVFLAVIERFLSKEGEADFQDWLENGKLRSGKDAITENKGWFKAEFGKRIGSFSK